MCVCYKMSTYLVYGSDFGEFLHCAHSTIFYDVFWYLCKENRRPYVSVTAHREQIVKWERRPTRCNSQMFIINTFSTCFGHYYAHLQETKTCVNQRSTPRAVTHGLCSPEDGHNDARNMLRNIDNKHLTVASCWFSLSLNNWEQLLPLSVFPPRTPHRLASHRTRASTLTDRRSPAKAVAQRPATFASQGLPRISISNQTAIPAIAQWINAQRRDFKCPPARKLVTALHPCLGCCQRAPASSNVCSCRLHKTDKVVT